MKSKWDKYEHMSPFEIKDDLIKEAVNSWQLLKKKGIEAEILNAGRGNPDFLNIPVRQAFSYLSIFAISLAADHGYTNPIGIKPTKAGIANHFKKFIKENQGKEGVEFLSRAVAFATQKFNLDQDDFIFCLADAALGDHYPEPPRIFTSFEKILSVYLNSILGLEESPRSADFNLFATEGGAAALIYIFKTLKINKLLRPKDSIAIVTPVFSPYLEIPQLQEYNLNSVFIKSDNNLGWQIPIEEIEKLKDPKIKALYLVNPANPTAVALNKQVLKELTQFVKKRRPDLIIITDTVYSSFIDDFVSIVKYLPANTICVYSFSKYFGVTGWRLGLVMAHKKNILDKKIRLLPDKDKAELRKRYSLVSSKPDQLSFIERLVLDSRDEALAHTGGLSAPQQSIMTLFALFELMDEKKEYKRMIHNILKERITDFYQNLGAPVPEEKGNAYYYSLLDFKYIAEYKYGKEFASYLIKNIDPLEFLFRLAKEKLTVLLPGKGFAGPKWSARISLANLPNKSYEIIGKNISDMLQSIYNLWKRSK